MRGKWTGNNSSNNRIQIDSAWREGYLRNDWKGEKGLSGLSAIVHSVEARPRAISTVPRQRIASFRSFTIDSFGPRFVPLCARRYLRANHSSCADARRARAVNLIPKQETLSLFSLSLPPLFVRIVCWRESLETARSPRAAWIIRAIRLASRNDRVSRARGTLSNNWNAICSRVETPCPRRFSNKCSRKSVSRWPAIGDYTCVEIALLWLMEQLRCVCLQEWLFGWEDEVLEARCWFVSCKYAMYVCTSLLMRICQLWGD